MFCPNCGAEYAQKINYCKRCGATMTASANNVEVHVPRPRLTGMFWAVSLFSIIGLIACFTAFGSFAERGLRDENLLLPFIFGLMFVGGISGLLVWQLSRVVSLFRDAVRSPKVETQPSPSYQSPRLATPQEPVSSISDHTTRSFDPAIYREAEKRRQQE